MGEIRWGKCGEIQGNTGKMKRKYQENWREIQENRGKRMKTNDNMLKLNKTSKCGGGVTLRVWGRAVYRTKITIMIIM